VRLTFVQQA